MGLFIFLHLDHVRKGGELSINMYQNIKKIGDVPHTCVVTLEE